MLLTRATGPLSAYDQALILVVDEFMKLSALQIREQRERRMQERWHASVVAEKHAFEQMV